VILGAHALDPRADAAPERLDALERGPVGARRRREHARRAGEEIGIGGRGARTLAARDGMRADERHAGRQEALEVADDRGLDAADVGHDRAGR
jgi:hypothetical protein